MAWNYNKLWKTLIDKGMNKTDLRKKCRIGTNVLAKMGRNEKVTMSVLEKICKDLRCNISDILEYDSEKLGE